MPRLDLRSMSKISEEVRLEQIHGDASDSG